MAAQPSESHGAGGDATGQLAGYDDRLRTFMRRTTDGIVGIGADGLIAYANPALCRDLQLTPEQIVGRDALEFVHPGDLQDALETLRADPRAIEIGPLDVRVRGASGRFIRFEAHHMNLAKDDPRTVVWILRNVTDVRAAETALAQQQALVHALAQGADVTFVIGEDQRVTYVSPGVERAFGVQVEQVVGTLIDDLVSRLVHLDDRAGILGAGILVPGPTVSSGSVHCRTLRPDGSWRWTEASYRNMLDDPVVCGLVLDIRDITEAHRAGLALLESEARYRSIVDAADEGIWMFGLDATTHFANPKVAELLGVSLEELIGTPYGHHFAREEDRRSAPERLERRRLGERERYETQLVRSDGATIDVYVSASPMYDAQGEFSGVLAMITDLTEYKAVERERAKLQEQREQDQRLSSLGRLAGGIAHDFNNLLGVILNYSTLMEREITDARVLDDLQQVRLAAQRAASLTSQLLSFARRDEGHPEPVAVNALVTRFAEMVERTLGHQMDVRRVLDEACPEPTVRFDPHQLERILLNLAINAADAMPDGGLLTITTSFSGPDANHPTHDGPWVRVAVSDTGHGMSEEIAARAFEPFFTTKRSGEGTGLGLAMVHGMIAQAGGQVSIESEPGRGTTVEILVPGHLQALPAEADAVPQQQAGCGRILLVEDEDTLRNATARLLTSHGYEVLEAVNGAHALDLLDASEHRVDIVLTDVAMPQMTGHELGAILAERHPSLPVIYVSGYDSPRQANEHLPVLRKPVPVDILLETIRDRLTAPPPTDPRR